MRDRLDATLIAAIERGAGVLSLRTLEALADRFGVEVAELLAEP